jgi:hypothetical protein
MRRIVAVVAALAGSLALAHEQGDHAMGVVESITPERIVVRTSDGHGVPFGVTQETRFVTGEKPGRAEDVRVGERVVVHGRREVGGLQAVLVKLPAHPAPK